MLKQAVMRGAGVERLSGVVSPLAIARPVDPGPGEVVLDVRAAGVGNWDDLMRTGAWDSGLSYPLTLGVEAAGVIAAVGADVADFAVGDPVVAYVFPFLGGGGCWAEQVLAPVDLIAPCFGGVDWAVAGVLPVPGLTAYQVVHDVLQVAPGQRLLVHGAGGVTGGLVVQLALAAGAEVVATASPGSLDRLAGYGPVRLVDRSRAGWELRVGRALGRGAAAAVNAAPGGSDFATSMVMDGGQSVSITEAPPTGVRGIENHYHVVHPDAGQLTVLSAMLESGILLLPETRTFGLNEANEALDLVIRGSGGAPVALLV